MKQMNKLFVIGDSISCYYGKYLKDMLNGVCEYDRKGGNHKLENLDDCTDGINGGDSSMVLTYFRKVLNKDFFHPDYLLLNCGLHDIKNNTGKLQIQPEQYGDNLNQICDLAKHHGIKLIWVRTTPLNENSLHITSGESIWRKGDIEQYNNLADNIMSTRNIPVIDLYSFTKNLGTDIYLNRTDTVHFNDEVARLQAAFIAGLLQPILAAKSKEIRR
ncbi:MAG: SGNH/GDSL hydrolase family protein [Lentisphaerota bacterium]